jgi:hypothetical protein
VNIDVASQNLIISPLTIAADYHYPNVVTLAVKFIFWEGSTSSSFSPTNSLQITISCAVAQASKFNPFVLTLGLGPKTTDLLEPSSKLIMTDTDVTTITVTDSGWAFDVVSSAIDPISSCGDIITSIISDVPDFVTITANSLVF